VADDLGRRRVFVAGLGVLAAGSLVCAFATGPWVFVSGRLLAGLGAGAVLACGLGLIGHAFPPGPARAHATGVWGASVGGGIGTGGLLALAADPGDSWRRTYVVVAVLAVVLAVAGARLLVESTADHPRGVDLLGAGLLASGLALVLAALVESQQGWGGGLVPALLGAGALLLAVFALVEARIAAPMLDLSLLRRRPFLAATVGAFANGVGATALAAFTPTLVQRGLGRSLLAASLLALLFAGTSVLTALQVRRLPQRWTSRWLLAGGLLGVAVGQLAQTGLSTSSSLARLVPGTVVMGIAFGVLNATVGREAVASVPPDRTAMGSGANNTARYVGSALGISLVAVVATRHGASAGAAGLVDG
jgi:predicted MFS family arabinose efflux permease